MTRLEARPTELTQSKHGLRPAPAITLRDIKLRIGDRQIIDGIDLDLPAKSFTCVIGPSGCGKTTLLRLAAGLMLPTSGQITYRGTPIRSPTRSIAVVFQDYGRALLPWRTVEGNVALALEAANVAKRDRASRVAQLLETVGLARFADRFPAQLSGGMQQRAQIARCLAQEPDVLLMDEPFGALDAMTRQGLQDEILRLVEARGTTVFFVTHDLEEAIYLGDRVVALQANPGRIARMFDVPLPRARNQLTTREDPAFLALRRTLFDFVQDEPH